MAVIECKNCKRKFEINDMKVVMHLEGYYEKCPNCGYQNYLLGPGESFRPKRALKPTVSFLSRYELLYGIRVADLVHGVVISLVVYSLLGFLIKRNEILLSYQQYQILVTLIVLASIILLSFKTSKKYFLEYKGNCPPIFSDWKNHKLILEIVDGSGISRIIATGLLSLPFLWFSSTYVKENFSDSSDPTNMILAIGGVFIGSILLAAILCFLISIISIIVLAPFVKLMAIIKVK